MHDLRDCSALIALGREFHSLAPQFMKSSFQVFRFGLLECQVVAGVSEVMSSTVSNQVKYLSKVLRSFVMHNFESLPKFLQMSDCLSCSILESIKSFFLTRPCLGMTRQHCINRNREEQVT